MADTLTGLEDHTAFLEALAAARQAAHVAVVVVEIEGLSALNAERGPQAADRTLKGVTAAVSAGLRRGDELFRVDGVELAAILTVTSPDEANTAAGRLRTAAARAGATVAVGAVIPHRGEDDSSVLERARLALRADRTDPVA
jgi:diguanylate cyclase (GGDEF)-like protein